MTAAYGCPISIHLSIYQAALTPSPFPPGTQIPNVEVWFMRASDVVRKVRSADLDLGIVGYDMVCELGAEDPELVVVHNALNFGQCYLALGVPTGGRYSEVNNLDVSAACLPSIATHWSLVKAQSSQMSPPNCCR